jgi:hypothetical protein
MKKQMKEMRDHADQLKTLYQSADESTRNKMVQEFLSGWFSPEACDVENGRPVSAVSRALLHGALVKLLIQWQQHLDKRGEP